MEWNDTLRTQWGTLTRILRGWRHTLFWWGFLPGTSVEPRRRKHIRRIRRILPWRTRRKSFRWKWRTRRTTFLGRIRRQPILGRRRTRKWTRRTTCRVSSQPGELSFRVRRGRRRSTTTWRPTNTDSQPGIKSRRHGLQLEARPQGIP